MLGGNIFGDDNAKDGRTGIGGHRAADPIDTAAFDMAALADLLFQLLGVVHTVCANDVVGTSIIGGFLYKDLGQAFNQLAVAPYLCFCFQFTICQAQNGTESHDLPHKSRYSGDASAVLGIGKIGQAHHSLIPLQMLPQNLQHFLP